MTFLSKEKGSAVMVPSISKQIHPFIQVPIKNSHNTNRDCFHPSNFSLAKKFCKDNTPKTTYQRFFMKKMLLFFSLLCSFPLICDQPVSPPVELPSTSLPVIKTPDPYEHTFIKMVLTLGGLLLLAFLTLCAQII